MKKIINNKNNLVPVTLSIYVNVVNYFHKNRPKYYCKNGISGNILWKYKIDNTLVAKRIVKTNEDDKYFIDKHLLNIYNSKN